LQGLLSLAAAFWAAVLIRANPSATLCWNADK